MDGQSRDHHVRTLARLGGSRIKAELEYGYEQEYEREQG
jgi:hypothetical protein